MAQALIELARRRDAFVVICAQTLPGESASTHILQKLGFQHSATVEHPEDGRVWEWRLVQ
jgi:L-amino acid N-acyltransferase YncA